MQVFKIILALVLTATNVYAIDDGMREEASTLENIYQEKAKSILNNLVEEQDYTIVVTAKIRNDEQKLQEYRDAVEKKFLPGLIITDPMGYGTEHNMLHELKQKVEIQVVLADTVPADREGIIKDILRSKLHLNEESGDSITVSRAIQSPERNLASEAPSKYPELSPRMIAFWIIVGILALTALFVWLQRRKERKRIEDEEREIIAAKRVEEDTEEEAPLDLDLPKSQEEIERERDALEMKIAFTKGELIKLVKDYPGVVCRAAEEYFSQGRVMETTTYLESLGWENSKKLFKDVDPRLWSRIGASLRERQTDPTLDEVYSAVHSFHRFALSFVLERSGRDAENPFGFVFRLTDSQRIDLLSQESPFHVALIAIYSSGAQMGELLSDLDPSKQHEVLLNIAKIKQLPEHQVTQSVQFLLSRLERIKANPSVHAEGPVLAADFMRSLDPTREETLYQMLLEQHPGEAEKLRRVRVTFSDIPYYPAEMVRKVLETLENEDLTRALVGYPADFVESFLTLLPTKKALMIQNDLFHMVDAPTHSQCAEFRRKICNKLELEFETQRFNVSEFWSQFDGEEKVVAVDEAPVPTVKMVPPSPQAEPAQTMALEQPLKITENDRTRIITAEDVDTPDVFPDDDGEAA